MPITDQIHSGYYRLVRETADGPVSLGRYIGWLQVSRAADDAAGGDYTAVDDLWICTEAEWLGREAA